MGNGALFAVVIGASLVFVVGTVLLVLAFRAPLRQVGSPPVLARLDPRPILVQRRKLTSTLAAAAVAGLASGWPVAALAAGAAVWFAPVVLGGDAGERDRIARTEAVAVWAEMLRDTLSSAAGLEQAVLASTTVAPDAIAGPLANLASDLRARRPFAEAMAAVADILADTTADQVVSSLIHAHRNQAKNLADLLGEIAGAARAQVSLAVRVDAERAKHRTSQRTITVIFSGMAVLLAVAYPRFLRPYDTALGQLVLLVLLGMFAGALAWMRRIVRPIPAPRLLAPNSGRKG